MTYPYSALFLSILTWGKSYHPMMASERYKSVLFQRWFRGDFDPILSGISWIDWCVLRREWMGCWGLLGWWNYECDEMDHSRQFPTFRTSKLKYHSFHGFSWNPFIHDHLAAFISTWHIVCLPRSPCWIAGAWSPAVGPLQSLIFRPVYHPCLAGNLRIHSWNMLKPPISHSLDWFKGNFTGTPPYWMVKTMVSD